MSATLTFRTEVRSYEWLTTVLTVMHREFDEKAGSAVWRVYARIPRPYHVDRRASQKNTGAGLFARGVA
jgi:hypothetical protein